MTICFQLITFNSDYILEPVLQSILPYGPVVCVEGPVRYWQDRGYTTSTDRTNDLLATYLPAARIVRGQWAEKDEMVWAAERLIPLETDVVWSVDSDEVYPPELIERVLAELDEWDSVEFRPYSFFGGFERYMTGYEQDPPCGWQRVQRWQPARHWHTHRPPTVLAPDGRPWRQHRHLGRNESERRFGRFFHYSYVFPQQLKDKTDYYHSWSQTLPNYFERVYLPWVRGDARQKQAIEHTFDGVHDWLPQRRGPCYTAPFNGEHPQVIQDVLPQLRARFAKELACFS